MKHLLGFNEWFQKNPKIAKNHGYEIIDEMSLDDAAKAFGTEVRKNKKKDRKYCLVTLADLYGTKCVNCETFGTKFKLGRARNGGLHWDMYADDDTMMTLDHIVPKSKGGGDNIENLQIMCMVCNGSKGNKHEDTLKQDVIFESFNISDIKKLKVGDVITMSEFYNYIDFLHNSDWDNDFIVNKIWEHHKYKLVDLPLKDISISYQEVGQSLVKEYIEEYKQSGWYPPIFYDNDEGIIDGYHRAKALKECGERRIKAFVGIN